ncbi:hypothetical protein J5300_08660 [Riemerella anatipestifer]|uniref:Uncharacterized protein n=1 Tax=Riemerella anatipestifer TaxID=34085 RepID=A0AAP6HCL3_RIEAN|nr:hypothetical protein [Riemerella anatipestifer]MBT0534464.1 hypothetical protein [Riemerella anatipestifer]MBT0540310.1 hypothetical protein [Riemerella anatipestifer]MBT0544264.1 hypothetical protein [Riemerella anatipestifer]MBT0546141.1 hypothetical protein [Riemerella anatipestifer]MBT0548167.1 hypothetical protein [Riemerella anatipestifer]
MKKHLFSLFLITASTVAYSQVGINTENPKATLDIVTKNPDAPDSSTGILVPRVSQNPASGNEKGQLIFNTSENTFFFWDDNSWLPIVQGSTTDNSAVQNYAYFTDTRSSHTISITKGSTETSIPNTVVQFTINENKQVQFNGTINFKGRSSAFAPLFKLKLTNTSTNTTEIIDRASNTFLSDGITDYYGNMQLLTIKELPAGNYTAEIVATYNDCCNFNFTYDVGGNDTPVSLLVQYK